LGKKQVCERVKLGHSEKRVIPGRRSASIIASSDFKGIKIVLSTKECVHEPCKKEVEQRC
jgi:hypothetical protein